MKLNSNLFNKARNIFVCLILLLAAADSVDAQKPNIVFILADDLGWADLPAYGNRFNEAPNLNTLCESGMKFTNAYAAAPVCSPTRASIVSGQYPARVGVFDFIPGHWRPNEILTVPKNTTQYLPLEVETIAETLKKAGYINGYFGKWHLGNFGKYHPSLQGFHESSTADGGFYNPKFTPHNHPENNGRFSEQITDFGIEFINKHKDKPFFLFLGHFDVHVPLDADKDLIEKYLQKPKAGNYPGNAVYAAQIEHIDRSVGRVMDELKALGLDENTIIIFYSDNGGKIKRYDNEPAVAFNKWPVYKGDSLLYVVTSNDPLRGDKGTLYEGGIRVPLFVSWPGKIEAGSQSDEIVTSPDFYKTLADITGAPLPAKQALDGVSIKDVLLNGKKTKERAVFWHYPVYHHTIPVRAIRMGNWKLIEYFDDSRVELYNLSQDLGEQNNLALSNKKKVKKLRRMLHEWGERVSAPMPVANPNFNEKKRFEWGTHPDRDKI